MAHRIVLTKEGYYTNPPFYHLQNYAECGIYTVEKLTIGRTGYGSITFEIPVNIKDTNLDETVIINHKEVIVYPNVDVKPRPGRGLNCAAEVRLERVWPQDGSTSKYIKDPRKLKEIGFEKTLREENERCSATFVKYVPQTGCWIFKVSHFSKYGYSDSYYDDNEEKGEGKKQKDKRKGEKPKERAPRVRPGLNEQDGDVPPVFSEISHIKKDTASLRLNTSIKVYSAALHKQRLSALEPPPVNTFDPDTSPTTALASFVQASKLVSAYKNAKQVASATISKPPSPTAANSGSQNQLSIKTFFKGVPKYSKGEENQNQQSSQEINSQNTTVNSTSTNSPVSGTEEKCTPESNGHSTDTETKPLIYEGISAGFSRKFLKKVDSEESVGKPGEDVESKTTTTIKEENVVQTEMSLYGKENEEKTAGFTLDNGQVSAEKNIAPLDELPSTGGQSHQISSEVPFSVEQISAEVIGPGAELERTVPESRQSSLCLPFTSAGLGTEILAPLNESETAVAESHKMSQFNTEGNLSKENLNDLWTSSKKILTKNNEVSLIEMDLGIPDYTSEVTIESSSTPSYSCSVTSETEEKDCSLSEETMQQTGNFQTEPNVLAEAGKTLFPANRSEVQVSYGRKDYEWPTNFSLTSQSETVGLGSDSLEKKRDGDKRQTGSTSNTATTQKLQSFISHSESAVEAAQKLKAKAEIAQKVVRYLMPYYENNRITSRNVFKAIARKLAHLYMARHSFIDDILVREFVLSYLEQHNLLTEDTSES